MNRRDLIKTGAAAILVTPIAAMSMNETSMKAGGKIFIAEIKNNGEITTFTETIIKIAGEKGERAMKITYDGTWDYVNEKNLQKWEDTPKEYRYMRRTTIFHTRGTGDTELISTEYVTSRRTTPIQNAWVGAKSKQELENKITKTIREIQSVGRAIRP